MGLKHWEYWVHLLIDEILIILALYFLGWKTIISIEYSWLTWIVLYFVLGIGDPIVHKILGKRSD